MYGRTSPLALFAVCCLSAGLHGQQAVTFATLSGYLEDPTGARVRDASVAITHKERGRTQLRTSSAEGRFQFLYLPAGEYELVVADSRFAPVRRILRLSHGQAIDIPLRLALADSTHSITVREEPAALEAARTQISNAVAAREVDSLPLNGRNYLDLALLAPGVSRTNTGAPQRFAETSAVPGTGISVAGQRNLNNTFLVDGLSANDDAAAVAGTFFSQEVIREFQVITSGATAEFGRASSGVISIATKSGTNEWHGRFYGFLRNQRLDARNPLAAAKDPLTQAQYGASAGGPLHRGSTFLFTNFEQTRRQAAGFVTIAPANVRSINEALDKFRYNGPRVTTGQFPTGYDSTNYFLRIDRQSSSRHQISGRYSLYDIASPNARSVGGLSDISRGTRSDDTDHAAAFSHVGTVSPSLLMESRVQFTRSRLTAVENDTVGPAVNIAGVASFGTSTTSPVERDSDLYEASYNVSLQRGSHLIKAGAGYLHNRLNIFFPSSLAAGVYNFSSIANFQAGRYITFQQAFGDPYQFQSNPNLGVFLQDHWRVSDLLAFQIGARYDLQFLPAPIATDLNNIAPRFGMTFSPGDRKTVIRAGYGLFFDRIPLRATSNALQRDGSRYRTALLAFGQPGAPVFPQQLAAFPGGQFINITAIDRGIENSYSQQANFQIEREFGPATIAAGYQWHRGLHLILARNVNVPTLTAAEAAARGVPNLGRPDSRYGNISRYEASGDSYFNGLLLSARLRAARWAETRISYTLSKAIDNTGNFFFSAPQNNFNLRDDRGLSDNDQRHRLTVSAVLDSPAKGPWLSGWQLSPLFLYTSALPFNILSGADLNGDTNNNDRPPGIGRNTGGGFSYASLDLRLKRSVSIRDRWSADFLIEAFNIWNRTNKALPNNVFGQASAPLPSFGVHTAVNDPRQVQVGVRLNF